MIGDDRELVPGAIPLIPGKFYWAQSATVPSETATTHYFSTVKPETARYHPLAHPWPGSVPPPPESTTTTPWVYQT